MQAPASGGSAEQAGAVSALLVVGISLLSATFTEALSWWFIYRTPRYQRIKMRLERSAKQLESAKRETVGAGKIDAQKKHEKRVEKIDKELKQNYKDMVVLKFKYSIIFGLLTIGVLIGLNRRMGSVAIAKLPFVPPALVQTISHRGLAGNDPTDCSTAFLLLVSNWGIRSIIPKLFGSELHRSCANMNPLAGGLVKEDE